MRATPQTLSRRGAAPGPHDLGWKDTVDISPSETVEVLVRFTDYAGRYLLHCHSVEHEDMGMMATFQTRKRPGDQVCARRRVEIHD